MKRSKSLRSSAVVVVALFGAVVFAARLANRQHSWAFDRCHVIPAFGSDRESLLADVAAFANDNNMRDRRESSAMLMFVRPEIGAEAEDFPRDRKADIELSAYGPKGVALILTIYDDGIRDELGSAFDAFMQGVVAKRYGVATRADERSSWNTR